jgi:uncharacterized membrane protein YbaN (DUF454 family)
MVKDGKKNEMCTTEQCLRTRPFWQRIVYPIVGIICIVLGIVGWIIPVVPGFPLLIIGIPLAACIHPRLELWMRRKMHNITQSIKNKFRRHASLN